MSTSERMAIKHWPYEEFVNLGINCGRTIKHFIQTMNTLSHKINASIAGASNNKAEAKAICRLIDNDKLTEQVILDAHRKATIQRIKESGQTTILSVQDTSMLNYTSLTKTEGLGDFGGKIRDRGLIVHSALAVTTQGIALGLLDQKIWTRDPAEHGKSEETKRRKPIEDKESYKWLVSMDKSQLGMPKGIRVVHVGDREADIYEFFDYATTNHQDFLVGVVQNRITTEACKLFDKIKSEPSAGEIAVHIPRDTRRNVPARTATLEVKYSQVHILAPFNMPKRFVKNQSVALSILLVTESNPPEGMNPIEWYLATSINISSVDDAYSDKHWATILIIHGH